MSSALRFGWPRAMPMFFSMVLLNTLCLSHAQTTNIKAAAGGVGSGGLNTHVIRSENIYTITEGFRPNKGSSVFHSFDVFSVGRGDIASFNTPGVTNYVARVIGGLVSEIHGTLEAPGNLFFINPKGVVLGQDASVNVSGTAYLSTAQNIRLSEGNVFVAKGESFAGDALLAGTPLSSFGFLGTGATATVTIASGSGLTATGSLTAAKLVYQQPGSTGSAELIIPMAATETPTSTKATSGGGGLIKPSDGNTKITQEGNVTTITGGERRDSGGSSNIFHNFDQFIVEKEETVNFKNDTGSSVQTITGTRTETRIRTETGTRAETRFRTETQFRSETQTIQIPAVTEQRCCRTADGIQATLKAPGFYRDTPNYCGGCQRFFNNYEVIIQPAHTETTIVQVPFEVQVPFTVEVPFTREVPFTVEVPTTETVLVPNRIPILTDNIFGRMTGGQPARILGQMQTTDFGNAKVWIINPQGDIFTPSPSSISTQSALLSVNRQSVVIPQQPSLAPLTMLAQRCAAVKGGEFSTFVQTNRDAAPPQPGRYLSAPIVLEGEQVARTQEVMSEISFVVGSPKQLTVKPEAMVFTAVGENCGR